MGRHIEFLNVYNPNVTTALAGPEDSINLSGSV